MIWRLGLVTIGLTVTHRLALHIARTMLDAHTISEARTDPDWRETIIAAYCLAATAVILAAFILAGLVVFIADA